MTKITFKGSEIHTEGTLPSVGSSAPDFKLVGDDLSDVSLATYAGKRLVLNIFPSIDTGICAMSAKRFNEEASNLENTIVLNVSKDLPFAQKRFCAAEGLEQVKNASDFRYNQFNDAYPVIMKEGPLAGLFSRAVVIVNEEGKIVYTEQVPEIVQEPDYDAALKALA